MTGTSVVSSSSDESEAESSVRGSITTTGDDQGHMARYLKYIALPEVQVFPGNDAAYSFSSFLDSFKLKYPRDAWSDPELCALFRAKLSGKAKSQYKVCLG